MPVVSKHSRVAALQLRFWYPAAGGPAGDLCDAVDVVDGGFVLLVFPAPQLSRRRTGLSAQSQHPQRGSG